MILTGHGHFASGMTSSIDLIAGPQESWKAVDFEDDTDKLEKELTSALDEMKDLEGVIVFADLAGGSPFKTAVLVSQGRENVEVIAGTNLPMLAEISMARKFGMDLATLVNSALETGKSQIVRFQMEDLVQEDAPEGEGI